MPEAMATMHEISPSEIELVDGGWSDRCDLVTHPDLIVHYPPGYGTVP